MNENMEGFVDMGTTSIDQSRSVDVIDLCPLKSCGYDDRFTFFKEYRLDIR